MLGQIAQPVRLREVAAALVIAIAMPWMSTFSLAAESNAENSFSGIAITPGPRADLMPLQVDQSEPLRVAYADGTAEDGLVPPPSDPEPSYSSFGCGGGACGIDYETAYRSVRFRRSEYLANPSYRHEAAMEIMFGQLRPMTINKHVESVAPSTVAEVPAYVPPFVYDRYQGLRPTFMGPVPAFAGPLGPYRLDGSSRPVLPIRPF
ncbi:hypothetical protein [Stratiformator vulcanicus]|uniref:hypothetical protein n=1 Tax=Stratiformator vulcanicus TaxID=2527980 RepID=UPI0011A5EF96|nr:hypothetical protein [Stratiformator vulcanicus]